MNQRKHRLGHWQVKSLQQILNREVCCSRAIIDQIGGKAKSYDWRYKQRLKSAIHSHNSGMASNSPIDSRLFIQEDHKAGFKLIEKSFTFAPTKKTKKK